MKAVLLLSISILGILGLFSCNHNHPIDSYVIEVEGKYGLIDSVGNEIVTPNYLYVTPYSSDGVCLAVLDTIIRRGVAERIGDVELPSRDTLFVKYGYIGKNGKFIFPTPSICWSEVNARQNVSILMKDFIHEFTFRNGLAVMSDTLTMRYGYMDINGDTIIRPKYLNAKGFSEGVAAVQKEYFYDTISHKSAKGSLKYGYIDTKGQEVSKFIFLSLNSQINGRAIATISYSTTIESGHVIEGVLTKDADGNLNIDKSKAITTEEESNSFGFSTYLVDKKGNIIGEKVNMAYSYANFTNDSICVAVPNTLGQWLGFEYCFIKYDGSKLEPLEYLTEEEVSKIKDSTSYCKGYWGRPDFSDVTRFADGYAGVALGSEGWGFVDKNLLVWFPEQEPYQEVGPFQYGLACVKKNGRWGYVDTNFEYVIKCQYDSCYQAGKNLMMVVNSSRQPRTVSYINRKGETVWQNTTVNDTFSSDIEGYNSYGVWRNINYEYIDDSEQTIILSSLIFFVTIFAILLYIKRRNTRKGNNHLKAL